MSPHVSSTLLSILAELNNAVIWLVSTCPLVSKSSSTFVNLLRIVPSASITIGITVTFMFHFFCFLARSRYFSLSSLSFNFTLWSAETESPLFGRFFILLLTITKSDLLAEN